MTTTTTTAPITLPLGTTPQGTDVRWHLTDETGHPQHGLILGPTGAGGSTTLARLATGAHAAGVRTLAVALDHGTDYLDPAWDQAPWNISRCADADDLTRGMDEVLGQLGPSPAPRLVLVDGALALRAAPKRWVRLLRQAARLQTSVVARVHRPTLDEFGGLDVLRSHLAAYGQYLALGRPCRVSAALMRDLLPGYIAPVYRQAPGRGLYGHGGTTASVTITGPRH